ncbi:MAG: ferritin family protein [Gammaproteobacteria bacterium]|nr:ferritin family protein [Gammaproteobacteria bacterium]MCP5426075.1 ferritin family protein [Gammaproteobacteria bacterium]
MNAAINSLDELLTHAHALEHEAVERYEELAGQMEVHNKPELAQLFHKMAALEQQHVDKVKSLAGGQPRRLAPWDYSWQTEESPESVPVGGGHYRMNPYQALSLVLASEERAESFFSGVATHTTDPVVRETATQFALEEKQHAELLREWLTRYPKPAADWNQDLDDPVSQE